MTQCERIVEYINNNGSITTHEAFTKLGITRLASRINDLKKSGYIIKGVTEYGKNRFGDAVHYKRYSFCEGAGQ